jgi:hypothetical protein
VKKGISNFFILNGLVLSCILVVCLKKLRLYYEDVVLCVFYSGGLIGRVVVCAPYRYAFGVLEFCLWCCYLVSRKLISCDVNVL